MITLTVTSFKGEPAAGNLSVSLDELGGTIGRADTNHLVLPDPDRAISRTHAQVVFRGGAYALIGAGANPVIHNGSTLERGGEVRLAEGDQIDIGSYRIEVSTRRAAVKVDIFEAAFGDSSAMRPAGPPSGSPQARAVGSPPVRSAPAVATPKTAAYDIPEDWDPFKDDHKKDSFSGASAGSGSVGGFLAGSESPLPTAPVAPRDSLDAMFGLGGGSRSGDPLAGTPLGAAGSQPRASSSADPLRSLLEPSKPVPKADSDHVSDLQTPWANAPRPAKAPPPTVAPAPQGAVFSWETDSFDSKVLGQSDPPAARAEAPVVPDATVLIPKARPLEPAARPVALGLSPPADAGGAASEQALLHALREGLGVPELRLESLTPETMRHLGQLLREATKGTVELLAARAALKRELRANVTMIVATENNSLKFSPSVDVALQYMLGPKMSGFMPPVESMRDAYDDLRAHQLGVMAGMKAALAGVLERFDPAIVESKLVAASGLASLIPSSRKAKLWELFQEVYKQLAAEAEEDFHTIYGAAFLRAYQEYVDQIGHAAKD